MSKSTLSDMEILDGTWRVPASGDNVRLSFKLPRREEPIISQEMHPDHIKGGVLIDWCAAIREQDTFDLQEMEAASERKKLRADPPPAAPAAPEILPAAPLSPEELIRQQAQKLSAEVDRLSREGRDLLQLAEETQAELRRWVNAAKGLGLELDITEEGENDEETG